MGHKLYNLQAKFIFFLFLVIFSLTNINLPAAAKTKVQQAALPAQARQSADRSQAFSALSTRVSAQPMLIWSNFPTAVYYEIEFLSSPPENPGGTEPSCYRSWVSEHIFTHGYSLDLSDYPDNRLFWRVRPFDIQGQPLAPYSEAKELVIDRSLPKVLKPEPTAHFNQDKHLTPLYPVYTWIPIAGAYQYEIEILDSKPEKPNNTEPSCHRIDSAVITGFSYYDHVPRVKPGTYYWRVRGLNGIGSPVGVYSDAEPFVVDLNAGHYAATFGDSITHGGGNITHSPAEAEYCFQSYLNVPVANLGKSGDTTGTLVQRFMQDVLPFRPHYLLILGGINNIRSGDSALSVINDLCILRNFCLAYNIRPVFLTLPPLNQANIQATIHVTSAPNWRNELNQVNDFIRSQPYYIDIAPALTDANGELPTSLSLDGLHPGIEGKEKMAAVINAHWIWITKP